MISLTCGIEKIQHSSGYNRFEVDTDIQQKLEVTNG